IAGEDAGQARQLKLELADFGVDWRVDWIPVAGVTDFSTRAADVVVTDLDSHGSQVLADLRAEYPHAVRILMLEPGQGGNAIHALDAAHRVLHKPLDAGELIDAVESVADLRLLLDNEELKRTIGQIESL